MTDSQMKLVILESPFAGDEFTHIHYLHRAIRDSIFRGEAPFASHKMYPGALSEKTERQLGINAGFAWGKHAELAVFYCDYGISPGMEKAQQHYFNQGIPFELRYIGRNH